MIIAMVDSPPIHAGCGVSADTVDGPQRRYSYKQSAPTARDVFPKMG